MLMHVSLWLSDRNERIELGEMVSVSLKDEVQFIGLLMDEMFGLVFSGGLDSFGVSRGVLCRNWFIFVPL